MSNRDIPFEGIGDAIAEELGLYQREVQEKLNKAGRKAIKELERKTKDTAPFNAGAYHQHYADLIATKEEPSRLGDNTYTWYVKAPGHRLTHLLVHGHETKDGGRTKADPFLANALEAVLADYEREVEEALT